MRIQSISRIMLKRKCLNGWPIRNRYLTALLRSLFKRNQAVNFPGWADFQSMLRQVHASLTLPSLIDAVIGLSQHKSKRSTSRECKEMCFHINRNHAISLLGPELKSLDFFISFPFNHSFLFDSFKESLNKWRNNRSWKNRLKSRELFIYMECSA